MNIKKLFIPLILILVTGCDFIVDADLPEQDVRMVANSFLSPDSTIWVQLENSSPKLSTIEAEVITDASLSLLTKSGDSYPLTYQEVEDSLKYYGEVITAQYYTTDQVTIRPGDTYTLKASHPQYPTISSTIEIPEKVSWGPVQIVEDRVTEQSYGEIKHQLEFSIQINDPAEEENYYAFYVLQRASRDLIYPDTVYHDTEYRLTSLKTDDEAIVQEYYDFDSILENEDVLYFYEPIYFSDEQFDGRQKKMNFTVHLYEAMDDSTITNYNVLDIKMMHVSKSMYLYAKSVRKAEDSIGAGTVFGEPVRVYSNIEHGFGILGGYTAYADSIVLARDGDWVLQ